MLPFYHRPVMLDEVIAGLDLKPGGVYFDGTVGGGGHSFAILESDPTVRVIGTDRDEEAIEAASERLRPFEGRFQLFKSDYRRYSEVLRRAGADKLDGVLLDLGISSHQIDDEERGFSYRKASAPLDMRMDRQSGFTAEDVVNDYAEEKLFRILRDYGEERFAGAIARNIVRERERSRITTCGALSDIVEESIPVKFRSPACARQTFQAIRIEVNGELPGYHQYWNYAVRKGYSGTAVFTKKEPLSVTYGIGIEEHDQEGRVITCEFDDFYFVTVYTPNSQNELARLDYRMKWEDDFRAYLKKLEEAKPVIVTGDMNVAHREIDLKNPKTNRRNAGFTDEERQKFTELLDAGFIDTFRYFYPEQTGIYSWWSYRFSARAKNAGWRIDYFCVSESLKDRLEDAKILTDVMGSDHCPVELDLK